MKGNSSRGRKNYGGCGWKQQVDAKVIDEISTICERLNLPSYSRDNHKKYVQKAYDLGIIVKSQVDKTESIDSLYSRCENYGFGKDAFKADQKRKNGQLFCILRTFLRAEHKTKNFHNSRWAKPKEIKWTPPSHISPTTHTATSNYKSAETLEEKVLSSSRNANFSENVRPTPLCFQSSGISPPLGKTTGLEYSYHTKKSVQNVTYSVGNESMDEYEPDTPMEKRKNELCQEISNKKSRLEANCFNDQAQNSVDTTSRPSLGPTLSQEELRQLMRSSQQIDKTMKFMFRKSSCQMNKCTVIDLSSSKELESKCPLKSPITKLSTP